MGARRLRGQAAVELAVVLPALMLLGMALVELVHWRVVHHLSLLALVDTVRHASTAGLDPGGIDRALVRGLQRLRAHDPMNPDASLPAAEQRMQRISHELGLPTRWWVMEHPSPADFERHHDAALAQALGTRARVIDPAWLIQREPTTLAAQPGSRTRALQLTLRLHYPLQALTPLGQSIIGSHVMLVHRVSAPMQAVAIEPAGHAMATHWTPQSRPWVVSEPSAASSLPTHSEAPNSGWLMPSSHSTHASFTVRRWLQPQGLTTPGTAGLDAGEGCGITLCCEPSPS